MSKLKVIAISGSTRKDSYNRKALAIAKKIAIDAGADVTEVDLKEWALPMYDGDVEAAGVPEPVMRLQELVATAQVLLLASPEYNNSVSGVLKNAIDWLSRPPLRPLRGKLAAIFGATNGMSGTIRGQMELRHILRDCDVLVLPKPEILIRSAATAFTPDGQFMDPKTHVSLKELIEKTLDFAQKIR